jgi:hypothetical protein
MGRATGACGGEGRGVLHAQNDVLRKLFNRPYAAHLGQMHSSDMQALLLG